MKSLHFILVCNADTLDIATNEAKKELNRFGKRNIGTADWYEIGSVMSVAGDEFTTPTFDRPVYTAELANAEVDKWLVGIYGEEMMAAKAKCDSTPHTIGNMSIAELSLVSRYYENCLEITYYRAKHGIKPFDVANGYEFNAGLYDEFGASWIVCNNNIDHKNYIVAVYRK